MNQSFYLELSVGQVHAWKFGQGEQLLIALHGFSDRGRMFEVMAKSLSGRFSLIALDLPFHGQTQWHKSDFSKQDLLEIMSRVLEKEGKTRFSLLGFSFGARLAQGMLPELASQVDHLYLLSPDGIKTTGMGAAENTPMWVRRWLYRNFQHANQLLAILRIAQRMHLISPMMLAFLTRNLSRPERIQRSFGCWLSMDSFAIKKIEIQRIITEYRLPIDLIIGAEDPLLSPVELEAFYSNLPQVRFTVLQGEGHRISAKWRLP